MQQVFVTAFKYRTIVKIFSPTEICNEVITEDRAHLKRVALEIFSSALNSEHLGLSYTVST